MKAQSQPSIHRIAILQHGISSIEAKFIAMMLRGMGDPQLSLQCWDGSNISNHPPAEATTVFLQSRVALWRFLFHPQFALGSTAASKGVSLEDADRFRQLLHRAKHALPAETLMVHRLLGIHGDRSKS